MAVALGERRLTETIARHARWVRISHGIATASILTLAFTGFVILMAHPRLYWGDTGNDLTPALIELPISRNYQHRGWDKPTPFFQDASGPISASRTYDIFNQNGWGRSLHFLAAWCLVLPGVVYLLKGIAGGHFRSHLWPAASELAPRFVWRDVVDHLRLRVPPASGGPQYGVLQKCAYSLVIFLAAPLMVLTGLTMAPAVTAGFPMLLRLFGGYQSARTIHFFAFVALLLFVVVHLVMVIRSGFRRQIRAMTVGD
jgi:thiosulfate reductase cytochrome b subunit